MGLFDFIGPASGLLFTLENIIWINLGVFIGCVFAAIPGLSVILCIILFLPVTYTMKAIPGSAAASQGDQPASTPKLLDSELSRWKATPSSVPRNTLKPTGAPRAWPKAKGKARVTITKAVNG